MDTLFNLTCRLSCYKLFLSGVFCAFLWIPCDSAVKQTKHGPVRGYESNVGSVTIYTFKNIPYAKPPTEKLRFELPEDPDSWSTTEDLRQDVDTVCPQPSTSRKKKEASFTGQEDCLQLDVYARNISETRPLLPVLIYFHAGMFSTGSKNEYHPEFLLTLHDIIVVIPNYRLGILGFVSGGSAAANLGLWDQRKCMQWVHENIGVFGGDKNRVTIAGHDAGGASVGFHILSPESHRFFSGAISGSGSVMDPWVFGRPRTASALSAAEEKVGCHHNSSDDVMTCLKMSDLDTLLKTQMAMKKDQFFPRVDGHLEHSFIPDAPQKLYQMGYQKNISYLAGVTRNEASIEVNRHFHEALKHKHLDSITRHLLEPYLRASPALPLIAKAAKYHYLRGAQILTFESVKPQMEMMLSDFLYNSRLHTTLGLHSVRTPSTFMYVFDFDGATTSPLGVTHMEDAFYLFNKTLEKPGLELGSKTDDVRKLLCDMWGNFIASGQPGDSEIWKKFRGAGNHQTNYVRIRDHAAHKKNYRQEAMEFWNLLIPDLLYYHNLSINVPKKEPFREDPSYTAWGLAGLAIILMALCVAMVGVVTVARRRYTQSSILHISSTRDNVQYSKVS